MGRCSGCLKWSVGMNRVCRHLVRRMVENDQACRRFEQKYLATIGPLPRQLKQLFLGSHCDVIPGTSGSTSFVRIAWSKLFGG